MKILLIGEYSRLHNSLKEGLEKLGNEVTILGFKDGFKDYPVDFPLVKKWDTGFLKKIKLFVLLITRFDITSYLTYKQFKKNKTLFKNFDVVQLINENSFFCNYHFEKKILKHLFSYNSNVFLLSCGDDYIYVNYNFLHQENKSIVQPYLEGKINPKNFTNVLKFRDDEFKKLHELIYQNIRGVIASDMDYHVPLQGNSKYLGLIPNPINLEKLTFTKLKVDEKLVVFHGINRENYFKKGNDFFEKALEIIKEKYPERVEIITVENVPYKEYINLYNKAHILLDQCFAYDQGYNALEAMSKGKVVFTGAEKEFLEHYHLAEDEVCINANPDVDYLVEKLSMLIENPSMIEQISTKARNFIEKEHNYITIAEKYLAAWGKK